MNTIFQPFLNPVKFTKLTPDQVPNYLSKFHDDWLFRETIKNWQDSVCFSTWWIVEDSIRLQFISNYGPLNASIFNTDTGLQVGGSLAFDTLQQDFFRPGYYIRQIEIDLDAYSEMNFYIRIDCGTGEGALVLISEPMRIVSSALAANTSYIEYEHHERYGDVIFNNGDFQPCLRVPSWNKYEEPGSNDTVHEDQPSNLTIVKSVPFDLYEFILSGERGAPSWFIKKMNHIFGCSKLKIDGRYWTKAEGSKWEEITVDRNFLPVSGWKIQLRERYNRSSIQYDDGVGVIGMNSMMAVMEKKGFGLEDNTSGDFLEYLNID